MVDYNLCALSSGMIFRGKRFQGVAKIEYIHKNGRRALSWRRMW
jgi:hypothetical protein